MFYTGIGSRETPEDICELMTLLAKALATDGYTLRSGGAVGADQAFQNGAVDKEIYLPWNEFNGFVHDPESGFFIADYFDNYKEATKIAMDVHPAWNRLSDGAATLHIRNVYQVLGQDLKTPSRALLYWAKPAKNEAGCKGGTATAVTLAKRWKIPTFNLFFEEVVQKAKRNILKLNC